MTTLEDYAKSQGFKANAGVGQGNAAFNMAAAKSLSETYKANPTAATTTGASQQAKDSVNMYNNSSYAKSGTTNDIAKIVAGGQQNEVKPFEKAVDNSGMINSQAESMAAAIRAQIAQRNQEIKGRITALPDKYQPDKNASEVAKAQQVRSLNEIAANQGDRGGIGRQNTLAAMVGGENRLNSVNLAQKQEEAALNNEIGRLMLEGDIQQANIQAQKLRDLIANNTAMNNTNYERQFNAEGRAQTQDNWLSDFTQRNNQFDIGQQNWQTTNKQTQDQNTFVNTNYTDDKVYNRNEATEKKKLEANKESYTRKIDERDYNNRIANDMGVAANPTANVEVPDEVRQQLSGYEGNYAQAAKDLEATGQTGLAQYARVLSNEKLYGNSALLAQYGQKTLQGKQVESGLQAEAIMNKLNQLKVEAFPEEQQLTIESAKLALQSGREDLAIKIIQKSQLPEEFKMNMGVKAEQIASSKANTAQGWEQIDISRDKATKTAAEKKQNVNQSYGEDFQAIKGMSWKDAETELRSGAKDYIAAYGMDGYKKLWNSVLNDAILDNPDLEMK